MVLEHKNKTIIEWASSGTVFPFTVCLLRMSFNSCDGLAFESVRDLGLGHKVHIYLEYHGVFPLVRIGIPNPSPVSECAPPPPEPAGWGGGGVLIRTPMEKKPISFVHSVVWRIQLTDSSVD